MVNTSITLKNAVGNRGKIASFADNISVCAMDNAVNIEYTPWAELTSNSAIAGVINHRNISDFSADPFVSSLVRKSLAKLFSSAVNLSADELFYYIKLDLVYRKRYENESAKQPQFVVNINFPLSRSDFDRVGYFTLIESLRPFIEELLLLDSQKGGLLKIVADAFVERDKSIKEFSSSQFLTKLVKCQYSADIE